jgi:hypothetical protein
LLAALPQKEGACSNNRFGVFGAATSFASTRTENNKGQYEPSFSFGELKRREAAAARAKKQCVCGVRWLLQGLRAAKAAHVEARRRRAAQP